MQWKLWMKFHEKVSAFSLIEWELFSDFQLQTGSLTGFQEWALMNW